MRLKRIIITSKDLSILSGRSPRTGRKMMTTLRIKYKKEQHQYITLQEVCQHFKIPEQEAISRLDLAIDDDAIINHTIRLNGMTVSRKYIELITGFRRPTAALILQRLRIKQGRTQRAYVPLRHLYEYLGIPEDEGFAYLGPDPLDILPGG